MFLGGRFETVNVLTPLRGRLAGGQPRPGIGDVLRGEAVAGGDGDDVHLGSAGAQQGGEAFGMGGWHQGVGGAVAHEHATAQEGTGRGGLIEDDHRTKEDCTGEDLRAELQEGGGDVGSVGKSHRDQPALSYRVPRGRRRHKFSLHEGESAAASRST